MSLLKQLQEADQPVFKPASKEDLEARKQARGPLKKFEVPFLYEVEGTCVVHAADAEYAEDAVYAEMGENGIAGLRDIDYTKREIQTFPAEELK